MKDIIYFLNELGSQGGNKTILEKFLNGFFFSKLLKINFY